MSSTYRGLQSRGTSIYITVSGEESAYASTSKWQCQQLENIQTLPHLTDTSRRETYRDVSLTNHK